MRAPCAQSHGEQDLETTTGMFDEGRLRDRMGGLARSLILAVAVIVLPLSASGQDRVPETRQALADLAYVLGQSHALRQACVDRDDQFWRDRMGRMLDVEAPDQALKRSLQGAFNTGFAAARLSYPRCGSGARAELARLAGRGKDLAGRLAAP